MTTQTDIIIIYELNSEFFVHEISFAIENMCKLELIKMKNIQTLVKS